MSRRSWLYGLAPLLLVCFCAVTWVGIRPRIALWRVEGQVRELLGGALLHEGLVSEGQGFLLLQPSVLGPNAMQADALRISANGSKIAIIHPVLVSTALGAQLGPLKLPFSWSIVDGHLYWSNSICAEGPPQPRSGLFLVNGSGDAIKSELSLISERDGVLKVVRNGDRMRMDFKNANVALLNDWFPAQLALRPLAGRLNGQLTISHTPADGWRVQSGSLVLNEAALQLADSGWLWQGSETSISLGGERLIIKAETSGKLIDPSGGVAWACADCQLYLEESSEGHLTVSGQGEEVSSGVARIFHVSAKGQRTAFLGQWAQVSLRIHQPERPVSEFALLHKDAHWHFAATQLQATELNIAKEYFVKDHPWLADWTPIAGSADLKVGPPGQCLQLQARDLGLRHRWGRIEMSLATISLTDLLKVEGGTITIDNALWSQHIQGEWSPKGLGSFYGPEWSLTKKSANQPARLRWSGPLRQLLGYWKIDSLHAVELDTEVALARDCLTFTGSALARDQSGTLQESAQFDLAWSLGDPIPLLRGTACVDQLPLEQYMKAFFPVSGRTQLQAHFTGTTAVVDFSVGGFVLSHPHFQFETDSLNGPNEIGHVADLPGHLVADWAVPSLQATIPIYGGRWLDRQTGLEVTGLTTNLVLQGKNFSGRRLEGYVDGLYFAGSMTGTAGLESHIDLTLETLHGTIAQVRSLLSHANGKKNILGKLPLDGKISLGHDGSWVRLGIGQQGMQASAVLCGTIFDGCVNVRLGEMAIQDVGARFTYQYPTQALFVDRILGTVLVGSGEAIEEYQLAGDHLSCMHPEARDIEFDLWIGDKARDIVRVVASTEAVQDGLLFHFDRSKTHLGQIHPSVLELSLRDVTQVDNFHLAFSCPLAHVWRDIKRVGHTGLFPIPLRLLKEMDGLKSVSGQLHGRVDYERTSGLFRYAFEANQLAVNGKNLSKGAFVGTVQGNFWSIEQARLGDFALSADVLKETNRWRVNFLGARLGGVLLAGLQGDYSPTTGIFSGQVNLFELNLAKLRDWKVTRAMARRTSIKGNLKGAGSIVVTAPLSNLRPWHTAIELDTAVKGLRIDNIAFKDIEGLKMSLSEKGLSFKNGHTAILDQQVQLRWAELKINPLSGEYAADRLFFHLPTKSIPWLFRILHKWQPRDWSAVQALLSGWEPALEGELKFTSASSLTSATVQLQEGSYRIGGRSYSLKDTSIEYSPYEFGITSKIDWAERTLWICLMSETPRLNQGRLMLSEESPFVWKNRKYTPLTLLWRRLPAGTLSVSDLKGSLWGVSVDLRPKEGRIGEEGLHFSGRVQANLNDLHGLLPDELAKGFQQAQVNSTVGVSGDWKFSTDTAEWFSVEGALTAHNTQAMGYQWDLLEASVKASPSNIAMKQVRFSDQAGSGLIPEASAMRLQDGRWLLSVPKLDLTNLTLNKIQRTGQARRETKKALHFSQLHLSGVEGTLGDRFGWHGEGSVDFTYQATEPATVFSRISIGSDVAYPAMGSIDFQVHNGAIHLTRLKDVFNEGKMVKFHLAERATPSTIGLDGSLNIAVQVKPRHILLKMMDKLTLEIAGTLKEPVCSVR